VAPSAADPAQFFTMAPSRNIRWMVLFQTWEDNEPFDHGGPDTWWQRLSLFAGPKIWEMGLHSFFANLASKGRKKFDWEKAGLDRASLFFLWSSERKKEKPQQGDHAVIKWNTRIFSLSLSFFLSLSLSLTHTLSLSLSPSISKISFFNSHS